MGDFKLKTGRFCPRRFWFYGGFSPGGLYQVGFYPGGFYPGGFSPRPQFDSISIFNLFDNIFTVKKVV